MTAIVWLLVLVVVMLSLPLGYVYRLAHKLTRSGSTRGDTQKAKLETSRKAARFRNAIMRVAIVIGGAFVLMMLAALGVKAYHGIESQLSEIRVVPVYAPNNWQRGEHLNCTTNADEWMVCEGEGNSAHHMEVEFTPRHGQHWDCVRNASIKCHASRVVK